MDHMAWTLLRSVLRQLQVNRGGGKQRQKPLRRNQVGGLDLVRSKFSMTTQVATPLTGLCRLSLGKQEWDSYGIHDMVRSRVLSVYHSSHKCDIICCTRVETLKLIILGVSFEHGELVSVIMVEFSSSNQTYDIILDWLTPVLFMVDVDERWFNVINGWSRFISSVIVLDEVWYHAWTRFMKSTLSKHDAPTLIEHDAILS